jgi:hypothetical protein
MEWTVTWFQHLESKWETRFQDAQEKGKRGQACYAKKQALMWEEMKKEAHGSFKKCLETTGI